MKFLKSFNKYKESIVIDLQLQTLDLMESLNIWHDALLDSISATELSLFDDTDQENNPIGSQLKEDETYYKNQLDLDSLSNDSKLINSLKKIGLKKSEVQNTEDIQTFINKPCKFMFIYDEKSNELENPLYVIMQIFNDTINKWDNIKLYKVNGEVKKFYDKLSSKTIKITDGEVNYIYTTSNGNDWELQNLQIVNDTYLRFFRNEEFEKLLSDLRNESKGVKITII